MWPACRFRQNLMDPKGEESKALAKFNWPLNDRENGGQRPIRLPQPLHSYPVMHADLDKLSEAVRAVLEYDGSDYC